MIEIKIRFKSGNVGYFKAADEVSESDMKVLFNVLNKCFNGEIVGAIQVIDLADNKRTSINMSEIASFGYSKV